MPGVDTSNPKPGVRIAHIVHLFSAPVGSEYALAQGITVETMRIARDFAQPQVEVELYWTQFSDDEPSVPDDFVRTRDLDRSVLDMSAFTVKRRLPLLRDITDRLYEASSADVLIYTNADIALMPAFYDAVAALSEDHDALTINRRTIPLLPPHQVSLMYAEVGEPHPGHDCFVFARSLYPSFSLGDVCIGTGYVGHAFSANLAYWTPSFRAFADYHLTFHLGNAEGWREPGREDYLDYNRRECRRALTRLDATKLTSLGIAIDPLDVPLGLRIKRRARRALRRMGHRAMDNAT